MITAGAEMQVLVATRPVDFRKQADGLAAIVQAAATVRVPSEVVLSKMQAVVMSWSIATRIPYGPFKDLATSGFSS